jgi:hypothetical protein
MTLLDSVGAYLAGLGVEHRNVAPGEWGLTLEDVGGWPLHVGLAHRDGLLRIQAEVRGAGELDAHDLLHRNRLGSLVRYSHTSAGTVWVQAELPEPAVDAAWLDRVLGSLVEAAAAARG